MSINLADSTLVTLVADAETPANRVSFAGIRIPIPMSTPLPANGVQDQIRVTVGGTLLTIDGYFRDGSSGKEWMMVPAIDPNIAALNVIPGVQGWTSGPARTVYANIGTSLLGLGITQTTVRTGLAQLYSAAVQNYVAEHGL